MSGGTLSCTAESRAMNAIVQLASQHPFTSFDAERPPLEEIFLSYYGAENA